MTARTTEHDHDDDPGHDPVAHDELASEIQEAGAWLFVSSTERDCWPVMS